VAFASLDYVNQTKVIKFAMRTCRYAIKAPILMNDDRKIGDLEIYIVRKHLGLTLSLQEQTTHKVITCLIYKLTMRTNIITTYIIYLSWKRKRRDTIQLNWLINLNTAIGSITPRNE
jgi:hypothetical protein